MRECLRYQKAAEYTGSFIKQKNNKKLNLHPKWRSGFLTVCLCLSHVRSFSVQLLPEVVMIQ